MPQLEIIVDKVSHEEALCVVNGASSGGFIISATFITSFGQLAIADVKFTTTKPTRKQLRQFKRQARNKADLMEAKDFVEKVTEEIKTPQNVVI